MYNYAIELTVPFNYFMDFTNSDVQVIMIFKKKNLPKKRMPMRTITSQ